MDASSWLAIEEGQVVVNALLVPSGREVSEYATFCYNVVS